MPLNNELQKYRSVGMVTTICAGRSGFRIPSGTSLLSLPKRPFRLWDPHSVLFNGYNGFLLHGVKQPEREADLSPHLVSGIIMSEAIPSTPATCLHDMYRENFSFKSSETS